MPNPECTDVEIALAARLRRFNLVKLDAYTCCNMVLSTSVTCLCINPVFGLVAVCLACKHVARHVWANRILPINQKLGLYRLDHGWQITLPCHRQAAIAAGPRIHQGASTASGPLLFDFTLVWSLDPSPSLL